jgi:hypothetical protein
MRPNYQRIDCMINGMTNHCWFDLLPTNDYFTSNSTVLQTCFNLISIGFFVFKGSNKGFAWTILVDFFKVRIAVFLLMLMVTTHAVFRSPLPLDWHSFDLFFDPRLIRILAIILHEV